MPHGITAITSEFGSEDHCSIQCGATKILYGVRGRVVEALHCGCRRHQFEPDRTPKIYAIVAQWLVFQTSNLAMTVRFRSIAQKINTAIAQW